MSLLPLFPLEVVLLPGTPLPLHIFEPRYKEMIGECLATSAPFGVIRALENGIAEVGCTAEIITVTKEYPDGHGPDLRRAEAVRGAGGESGALVFEGGGSTGAR